MFFRKVEDPFSCVAAGAKRFRWHAAEGVAPKAGPHKAAWALVLTASFVVLAGCGATRTARPTTSLVSIGAGLKGPATLSATIYAKGPATTSAFAFDSRGRLWVTAAGLEAHTHDGVYMIAGKGTRAVRIIAGLNDPLGIAWYRNTLYVASIGRVDAYRGFDGRRFAHHVRVLNGPLAGAENNLLVMAPDGRFVMGVTAACDDCAPTSKWSGSIVSFRPDGSDLRLYARRIRAPVGLAFFPGTSDLLVSMNQRDDLGTNTPGDALGLVREGEDWRFPDCYSQGGAACYGVPSPVALLDKHAAVGGLAIATGQLGANVGPSALVTEWNVAKVQSVALSKASSGYTGFVTPFLTGIQHPLAIAFAPDGSLLVGDWASGTIYRVAKDA